MKYKGFQSANLPNLYSNFTVQFTEWVDVGHMLACMMGFTIILIIHACVDLKAQLTSIPQ